jgi:hypothetical protein
MIIDMLDNAKGNTAEPRNLLRVLRQVPEASALGLLDATEPSNELTLAMKIQDLFRFVLRFLNKETRPSEPSLSTSGGAPLPSALSASRSFSGSTPSSSLAAIAASATGTNASSSSTSSSSSSGITSGMNAPTLSGGNVSGNETTVIEDLFGATIETQSHCLTGKHPISRDDISFHFKLTYPTTRRQSSFTDILQTSLCEEVTRRLWCDGCGDYQPVRQSRLLRRLPAILSVHANVQTDAELDLWRSNNDAPKIVGVSSIDDDCDRAWLPHMIKYHIMP